MLCAFVASSTQYVNERRLDGESCFGTLQHRYIDISFFLCVHFHKHLFFSCVCVFFFLHFFPLVVIQNMDYGMEGTNIALAVFIPTAIILVVVLGIYVYFAK